MTMGGEVKFRQEKSLSEKSRQKVLAELGNLAPFQVQLSLLLSILHFWITAGFRQPTRNPNQN